LPLLRLAADQHLHITAADIDHQDFHEDLWRAKPGDREERSGMLSRPSGHGVFSRIARAAQAGHAVAGFGSLSVLIKPNLTWNFGGAGKAVTLGPRRAPLGRGGM